MSQVDSDATGPMKELLDTLITAVIGFLEGRIREQLILLETLRPKPEVFFSGLSAFAHRHTLLNREHLLNHLNLWSF
jgi:hypothetical protein